VPAALAQQDTLTSTLRGRAPALSKQAARSFHEADLDSIRTAFADDAFFIGQPKLSCD